MLRTYNLFLFFLLLSFLCITESVAQSSNHLEPVLYIDVLVDTEERIFVQNHDLRQDKISKWVEVYISSQPALKYDRVVYRIYAGHDILLGRINEIASELLKGYNNQIQMEKYLINRNELDIDGSNYIQKLNKLNLKALE